MSEQTALLALETSAEPAPLLNTAHAREMLRKRFAQPEWALLEEVAPATGGGTRYADAVALNLWSSRGHAVYGFEIKTARSDWLRELRQPAKTEESVYAYCDRWFLVAPKGVINDGELPPTWGLLELRTTGLFARVEAPKLTPKSVDRGFAASLIRRGFETVDKLAERKQRDAVSLAHAEIEKRVVEEVSRQSKRQDALAEQVRKFKEATGLDIGHEYRAPPIGAIKLAQKLSGLQDWREDGAFGELARLAEGLERAAKMVREAVAQVEG